MTQVVILYTQALKDSFLLIEVIWYGHFQIKIRFILILDLLGLSTSLRFCNIHIIQHMQETTSKICIASDRSRTYLQVIESSFFVKFSKSFSGE